MREMKDSGVEWIGEIPRDWEVKRVGSYFSERKEPNSDELALQPLQFRYGNIVPKTSIWEGEEASQTYMAYNIVDPNTVMINGLNLEFDFITQRVGLVEERGIITSVYLALDPSCEVVPRYGLYLFKSYDFCKVFHSLGSGMRKTLTYRELKRQPVILPSLQTQHRIADYLDAQCARIDRVIARQQEIIEKLKEYKLAVITEAVTKGLNPGVPMKDSGIEWIGEIPEGWEIIAFTRIAQVKSNLVDPALYPDLPQISPESIEKDSGHLISYVSVADSGVFSYNHYFYKGQILYSKIRPKLNKICIAPFDGLCSADMYPIETTENTRFILYCMLSQSFLSQVSMVTESRVKMPKINQSELGRILLAIPQDKQVEDEIASYLDVFCVSTDLVISQKLQLIDKITEYKKSLIYEVVTGKREV